MLIENEYLYKKTEPFGSVDIPLGPDEEDGSLNTGSAWQSPKTPQQRIAEGEANVALGLAIFNVPDFTPALKHLEKAGESFKFQTPPIEPNGTATQAGTTLEIEVEKLRDGGYYMKVADPEDRPENHLFRAFIGTPTRLERVKGAKDLVITLHTGFTDALAHTSINRSGTFAYMDEPLQNAQRYVPQLPDIFTGKPANRI